MALKQIWADGGVTCGVWSGLDDPQAIQVLGHAGFDFVSVDLQHGFASLHSLRALLDALDKTPTAPVVRVPWSSPDAIGRALDLGAEGIIVPMVSTAEEARQAAAACRYAPTGTRSWGPLWQETRTSFLEPDEGDARATCIVMIETAEGLENIDEIAATPGVDATYIGPNDLAISLGLGRTPWPESPELEAKMQHVIDRTREAGKVAGCDVRDAEQTHYWADRGAQFMIAGKDAILLRDAARALSDEFRARSSARPASST